MKYSRKGIYNSQNNITLQKVKNMKHFVSPASNLAPKMVVPLASPGRGRIIVVFFEQNMPFVVKLNPEFFNQLLEEAKAIIALSLFLLACVVSVGQLIFDCRSYCGLSRRMQGYSHTHRKASRRRQI